MRDLAFRFRMTCLSDAGRGFDRFTHLTRDSLSCLAGLRRRRRAPHGWCSRHAIHELGFKAISQSWSCGEQGLLTADPALDSKKGPVVDSFFDFEIVETPC